MLARNFIVILRLCFRHKIIFKILLYTIAKITCTNFTILPTLWSNLSSILKRIRNSTYIPIRFLIFLSTRLFTLTYIPCIRRTRQMEQTTGFLYRIFAYACRSRVFWKSILFTEPNIIYYVQFKMLHFNETKCASALIFFMTLDTVTWIEIDFSN